MAARPFAHLHCHTHYSLLDGANRIPELVEQTKALGMTAAAITDHGNLFGAIEFYNECKKAGINPVIGYEAYLAPGSRHDKTSAKRGDAYSHLTLLAKNYTGFKNLVKLSSIAYTEGFYHAPRIDREVLEAHHEGLICLSGCLAGEFNDWILKGDVKKAEELAKWFSKLFKKDFYIELQNNGLDLQDQCTVEAVRIADKMGLPLVATADAHYLCEKDAAAHDVLVCINTGKKRSDPNRMRYGDGCRFPNPYYVRSADDMYRLFPGKEEAVKQSQLIADAVDIQIDFKKRYFPVFTPPKKKKPEEYLRELCLAGIKERYGENPAPEVLARMEHELGIICKMGFASYFLIVWDFVRFALENGIPCSARGSGCGAIVSYALKLSHVCPLQYDLLFERFLDPNRSEAPDIDIDFCQDRRELVIDYVKQAYGEKSVAQIATFGTMAAKAAIKDVGRVLDIPLDRVNFMTKWVSNKPGTTIQETIDNSPEFRREYETDPTTREWIDIALKLEGTNRNAGTHAAGVVIANGNITDYVPVQIVKRKDESGEKKEALTTQWVMGDLEKVGMLKMDFLGLRTLTLVDNAVRLIKKTRGLDIDVYKLPLDDAPTYKLLQRGDAKGVFQFESEGIRELLKRMKPDNIRDIIACTALYRPGPLEGGMVDEYIDCKHGRKQPSYEHPVMEEILSETYGVMVYQEQVMRILNKLGHIELSSAYACIKAISKKKHDIIDARKVDFVNGARRHGLSGQKAEEIFNLIVKFGGYGFNKCVVAETEISDAVSGERTTVGDLFNNRRPFTVHSLDESGKLVNRRVQDVVWNGRKRVYRLTTVLGKTITATGNHPFRTLNGWTELANLKPGDRVAAPRHQRTDGSLLWPRHEVIALAGLLSEGNMCHPSTLYFYGKDRALVEDFAAAAAKFPHTVARVVARRQLLEVIVNTGADTRFVKGQVPWNSGSLQTRPAKTLSGAFLWARRVGLLGRTALTKRVTPDVFRLGDEQIELFLGRLWSGDGFIANATLKVPFYATSSRGLATDVQNLLLRLGIVSRIHSKQFRYRGGLRPGYTVHLLGEAAAETFLKRVAPYCVGRDAAIRILEVHIAETRRGQTSKDTVPAEIRSWVDAERKKLGLTWTQLEEQSGVSMKEFLGSGGPRKQGFRRSTIDRLARFFDSTRLRDAANSDVFWDRVASIEPAGIQDTYDLTVETDHNFIADGLIVHNSHSAAYALVSYQTAYLKQHYPAEFMAALLSSEIDDGNKRDMLVDHIGDAKKFGVNVLPPDVNRGEADFTVHAGQIVFGLTAIKGLGRGAAENIAAVRKEKGEFKDLYDFCERVDLKTVTKSAIEKLIMAGAFDKFATPFAHRAQLMAALPGAIQNAEATQKDKQAGQMTFFDVLEASSSESGTPADRDVVMPNVPRWSNMEQLKAEKEALDFYFSSHPLAEFEKELKRFVSHDIGNLRDLEHGQEVRIGGMMTQVRFMNTKKGDRFVRCKIEDFTGQAECVMWPSDYQRYKEDFREDRICIYEAGVEWGEREDPIIVLRRLMDIEQARKELTKGLILKLALGQHSTETIDGIFRTLKRTPGPCQVYMVVRDTSGRCAQFRLGDDVRIHPAQVRVDELEMLLGEGAVVFTGR